VVAADLAFRRISASGCTWALWGAAHLITGGCSDEGFDCFRGQLVALGREVFENAVADPDSLADAVGADGVDWAFDEGMLDAPWTAYRTLTGEDPPRRQSVRYPALGESWDFGDEAEMRVRYPRLAAVFP
jgi:hypothetical protein